MSFQQNIAYKKLETSGRVDKVVVDLNMIANIVVDIGSAKKYTTIMLIRDDTVEVDFHFLLINIDVRWNMYRR